MRRELAASMGRVRLAPDRVAALAEDLRQTGERLRHCEGALLRLAIECGVSCEAFLETDWASSAGKIMPNGARPLPDAHSL